MFGEALLQYADAVHVLRHLWRDAASLVGVRHVSFFVLYLDTILAVEMAMVIKIPPS